MNAKFLRVLFILTDKFIDCGTKLDLPRTKKNCKYIKFKLVSTDIPFQFEYIKAFEDITREFSNS